MPNGAASCPALTTALVPPESVPLAPMAPWQPAPEPPPRANSSHFFMYVPPLATEEDQHSMRSILRANQFPSDLSACNRTLILYDDALTAGLGYSARLIALALLVAVQEKRVLMNIGHYTARWCGRPPYTLGCYYEPMTHCPVPESIENLTKWSTRGSTQGLELRRQRSAPHMRISTSQIHRSIFWYKFHPPQSLFAGTHDLLFRPRAWVREAARCAMRAAGLHGGNFAVVHARFSAEKKKERGSTLPPLEAYLPATELVLSRANISRVFLQTSTPGMERWRLVPIYLGPAAQHMLHSNTHISRAGSPTHDAALQHPGLDMLLHAASSSRTPYDCLAFCLCRPVHLLLPTHPCPPSLYLPPNSPSNLPSLSAAVELFASWSKERSWQLSYTQNARSSHE